MTAPVLLTVPQWQRVMTRNILRTFRAATGPQYAAGIGWYPAASDAAREMAYAGPVSTRVERAAGVIAALSPRTQWRVNLAWAATMLGAVDAGQPCPRVAMTSRRAAAWRIAQGEPPGVVLSGPKVRAFYRAILGDPDSVCVDVWAARAALGGREWDDKLTAKRYGIVADAYRRAAARTEVSPRDLQAIVWVVIRGRAA